MIQTFVDRFITNQEKLKAAFAEKHVGSYRELIKCVITAIADSDEYETPSIDRIHQIDDGDYQGTLVFVIGATGYQPDKYWYVKIAYGSCSGCDTLQRINDDTDSPTEEQVADYMTLALHIVQRLKEME